MAPQASFVPRGRNIMTLRVTSYENRCLCGTLRSPQLSGELAFTSAMDLLLQMEQIMDTTNSPQRNEESRSFGPGRAAPVLAHAVPGKAPALAVFQVYVMFRQNATWQGSLLWIDADQEARFRSVLELLQLMDSALTGQDGEQRHDR